MPALFITPSSTSIAVSCTNTQWVIISSIEHLKDATGAMDTGDNEKKIPVTQKWNHHPVKETSNAVLHSPAEAMILTFQRGKRGGASASKAQLVLTETNIALRCYFLHPGETIFYATFLELYSCMRNASVPTDEVISAENWLPSKKKGGLLRCFWKRWKNFQNSSLMLYHIWDFQIHSWLDNHFRLQAIWLTVSVASSTQSFIYLLVTKGFLCLFPPPVLPACWVFPVV